MEFITSTIGKIAKEIKTGKTPPTKNSAYFNGTINWYTPTDLDKETYLGTSTRTITELAVNDKKATLYSPNTVLIGCIGNIGKLGIITETAASNQQITGVLTDDKKVLPEFFFYWLKMNKKLLEKKSKKAVVPILNNKQLSAIPISYPKNTADQERIIQVLSKTEMLISQRIESIDLADEFLKHTFLTMFGDPVNNTKNWGFIKLSELGKLDRGVSKHRPRNAPELLGGDYPLIQTGDVSNAGLYITKYTSTYSDLGLKQSKMWPKGTLCITIAANIAKTGILTFDACFPDSVVGFTPKKTSVSLYVHFLMGFLQSILEKNAPQAAQKNINLGILRSLMIPNPNKDLLVDFEKIVNQTESIKNHYTESLNELNELYHSLSHKAFTGELTIIEKIEIEGSIKIQPKISGSIEVIDIEEEEEDDGYRSYTNDRTEPWHFGIEEEEEKKSKIIRSPIPDETKKKEKLTASITHVPFLKTEEDLLSHIIRNCKTSHFTFEEIKNAVKGLDWKYDFEELKNLVFSLVRGKKLEQIFADASYKAKIKKTDPNYEEIMDLNEQIYFKRML